MTRLTMSSVNSQKHYYYYYYTMSQNKKAQLTQGLRATALPPSSEPEMAPIAPLTPKTQA